jgi:4-hydroxy-tetrahydrodipicolinate reductase
MEDIRVAVSGTGKMGRQVADAVNATEGMRLVGFLDGLATDDTLDGLVVSSVPAHFFSMIPTDVVVDFTNAAWTPGLAQAALEAGCRMVIGTTGLGEDFVAWLDQECEERKLGSVLAPNFAIGAILMMHFAKQASRFFDHAEIIELHHDQKVDSPSGTAKTTAEMMLAARQHPFEHRASEKETIPGARGAESGGIAIHSVRLPGFVAHQEVIFGGLGQTLSIRHDSTGRDSFMPGVVAAISAVMESDRLVVGLDRLFGLD